MFNGAKTFGQRILPCPKRRHALIIFRAIAPTSIIGYMNSGKNTSKTRITGPLKVCPNSAQPPGGQGYCVDHFKVFDETQQSNNNCQSLDNQCHFNMPCLTLVTAVYGIIVSLLLTVVGYLLKNRSKKTVDPELLKDHHWSEHVGNDDQSIRPFKVEVSDELLEDLKSRLAKTRIHDSLPDTAFEYGFRSEILRQVIDYWTNEYDWRKVESEINQVPHFKTKIEGIDIHFVHVKAKNQSSSTVPIIFSHGWPSCFVDFLKGVPVLQDDYDLVIPSLPGYGFSEAARKAGCHPAHIARIYSKLMARLGYKKYIFHGEDWGAAVGLRISSMYPREVIGLHLTSPFATLRFPRYMQMTLAHWLPNLAYSDPTILPEQKWTLGGLLKFMLKESGYFHIQATKPDTVGYALNDSPAGLAAYIIEKYSTWTNSNYVTLADGGLFNKFTLDQLITNVMIYWINGNITSSMRLYKEAIASMRSVPVEVPTGITPGKYEVMNVPKSFLSYSFPNLVHYNPHITGGHFLFLEQPSLLARDLKNFADKVSKLR